VTKDRLGVYRPEEHIDNPLGYADGMDARKFDARLRGPVQAVETEIDMRTGMKNYICNETGGWATSAGYLRFSFARSIHYGRVYTSGLGGKGKDEDLCEALRCLGQALHCMEVMSNFADLFIHLVIHYLPKINRTLARIAIIVNLRFENLVIIKYSLIAAQVPRSTSGERECTLLLPVMLP
jgi:hypothetical protein